MRVRICDGCKVILRGRYSKVIPFGGRPGKTLDLCPKCMASLLPHPPAKNPEPKTRRLFDVPLDGSPIRVHEVQDTAHLTPSEVDRILNQGDYPPDSSPK